MRISLAYFESVDSSAGQTVPTAEKGKAKENILEGRILNQLIHQISDKFTFLISSQQDRVPAL